RRKTAREPAPPPPTEARQPTEAPAPKNQSRAKPDRTKRSEASHSNAPTTPTPAPQPTPEHPPSNPGDQAQQRKTRTGRDRRWGSGERPGRGLGAAPPEDIARPENSESAPALSRGRLRASRLGESNP